MSLGSELAHGWQSIAVESSTEVQGRDQRPLQNWQTLKSALLASATSVIAIPAGAQQAEPVPLPPLNVEATAKKKAPAKKAAAKKAAPAQQVSPAPQPAQPVQQAAPLPGEAGPPAPGSFNANFSSSPKMTAPLLDTPQTVNVITNAVIEERNATTLTEALRNVPGITFNAGENAFSSNINNFQIRGFDSSGNIFVDGVRDSGSYARDMFNVDRVEVVKGPAADNGRGGAGGYVNIVTKAPVLEDFVHASTVLSFDEYGSDVHSRSTIDVNQRIGTVAVRMNGLYEEGGIMGREEAELNAYGLAPSIAFGLGTDTRAIFSYERLERQDIPDWGVPAAMVKGMFRYNAVAGSANRDNFYGLSSDFDDVQGDSVVARLEHDLSPDFTISNQTRWSRTDRLARFTFPNGFTPVGANNGTVVTNTQFYDRENTSISNLTNLSGTFIAGGFRHTISTGVELTHEESEANRQAQIANLGGQPNIFNPNPHRAFGPAFNPTERNGVEIDTVAAYAYDTIELSRHWELTGGLRVEHYNVEFESKAVPSGAPLGLDGHENSETTLGGKIGLVYKPVREGSVYASYGVSALPPGSFLSNADISRTGDGSAFPGFLAGADPVEMHNYEVGVKWDFFGGRLSTTAAAFHTEKRKVAYGGLGLAANPAVGWPGNTIAYGEQVVEGIELSVAGNITERWKAFGGILVMDSERRHSALVDAAIRATNTGDYGTGQSPDPAWVAAHPGGVTTTDGDELAFTPNFTATLWTTYDVTDELTLGGGVQYVGESWLGRPDDALRVVPNGKFGKLPDYFLVNLMASYELTETVDLQLNVDNVFDEFAAVSANWPGQRALIAPPRTWRIGTSIDY